MPRYIDLDKIDVFHQEDEDVVFDIIHATPVDAIPIEWIEDIYIKYMKKLKDSDNSPMSKKWFELRILAYRMLIRDWRKENEQSCSSV